MNNYYKALLDFFYLKIVHFSNNNKYICYRMYGEEGYRDFTDASVKRGRKKGWEN